jgi:hypothetical protein
LTSSFTIGTTLLAGNRRTERKMSIIVFNRVIMLQRYDLTENLPTVHNGSQYFADPPYDGDSTLDLGKSILVTELMGILEALVKSAAA